MFLPLTQLASPYMLPFSGMASSSEVTDSHVLTKLAFYLIIHERVA